ncbi:MMPL family transporter [Mycobacterium sp. IDR2000157661]|uniref:MMPL family transporter n=1 Tax=Mycobacterium sp. IDR2000157661 TaxID=2867005 RepID=UPI001EEB928D|nr:MMPL family transporter [Mycobacterium sp. IDR2000157661]ULE32968.1 MMPL family transporter [Mycobacterium sp. IDR2000157661]
MTEPENVGRLSRAYAVWIVRLRWLVVVAMAAAATLATMHLPGLQSDAGLEVTQQNSPAVQSEQRVLEAFGLPLLSLAALVQHDSDGLNTTALERSARRAVEVNVKTFNEGLPATGIAGALPIPNAVPVPLRPTTVVTYLWGGSTLNSGELVAAARQYGEELGPQADVVGVTGVVPVQVEQGLVVKSRLGVVEIATLLAVALILAISCRSLVAPLITLSAAVVAYLITIRLIGAAAAQLEISAPSQLEPLVVALTLGLTTDYAILFVTGMRYRSSLGWDHRDALRSAITHNLPIVLVAGLIVTAGVGSISVAELPLFRAFGPGLAIVVAVALLVSITLVPALLAIFGRLALWPGTPRRSDAERRSALKSERFARMLTKRPVAAVAVAVSLAALIAAGYPLTAFRPAVSSPDTLPVGNEVRVAADAAAEGFPAGVLAPTEILLEEPGITAEQGELVALQDKLAAQPGVAAVVGPQQQPIDVSLNGAGLFLAPGGDAARYLVIFDQPGLSASGLQSLIDLQSAMPVLQEEAGLAGARVEYIGAGALGAEFVSTARSDFVRVGIAVGVVNLVLLMVFLRAFVAPVYLLACSYLSVGAALGLTTLVFQQGAGYDGLIFYAPFAAAVLLISLGSDYNVFTVGQIWDEARSRSLRDAVAVGLPRSARPVTIAGLALATSFAFVGLVPVAPFQQLAFAVAVGVLIDTFLVRSLLVPGLIVLIGRVSGWPGRRLVTR